MPFITNLCCFVTFLIFKLNFVIYLLQKKPAHSFGVVFYYPEGSEYEDGQTENDIIKKQGLYLYGYGPCCIYKFFVN